jgi:hypothetical protein
MKTLFSYFGGKWLHAGRYPRPEHDVIVEPFAGSAGYSVAYYRRKVILVEKHPPIAALWRYLIQVKSDEIRKLPILQTGQRVSDFKLVPEAATLLGLRLGRGSQAPRDKASSWGTVGPGAWNERARETLALQVELIRHWRIIEGDYTLAPDIEATWHIDPPYSGEGFRYPASSTNISFSDLAGWCKDRKGLVMVCEQQGATWLPFVPFFEIAGSTVPAHGADGQRTTEVIWINRAK